MTENEAIKQIRKQICNEKGVQRYCRDNCMYGIEHCAYSMAIQALEEIQQYRAIGTIDELKDLKEKNIPKEPIEIKTDEKILYMCPSCRKIFIEAYDTVQRGYIPKFCEMCGQDIKWP